MDDENPYGQGLSYDDDVPYEAQVDEDVEVTETSEMNGSGLDLKKRIGKRIYVIEDSLAKKRKHEDLENQPEEDDLPGNDADLPYRPNALLLQGPTIAQLPTKRVFAYAVHFDAHPIGLEWVDDTTCILVFNSRKAALHAWTALRKPSPGAKPDESSRMDMDEPELVFILAHSLPMALYPIEERINSVLGTKKSEDLKQAIQMRWALKSDVKARDAKSKSQFYKRFGETAGKPGDTGDGSSGRRRMDDVSREQLDAELDGFSHEEQRGEGALGSRLTGRQSTGWSQTDEDKRRLLDAELDAFLAGGEDTGLDLLSADQDTRVGSSQSLLARTRPRSSRSRSPRRSSLLERTRSQSPVRRDGRGRRERPSTKYEVGEDGRWLHNAEVVERRRRVEKFDSRRFGMRAWNDEISQRSPKIQNPRKTQEDLDRELEEFGRQAD